MGTFSSFSLKIFNLFTTDAAADSSDVTSNKSTEAGKSLSSSQLQRPDKARLIQAGKAARIITTVTTGEVLSITTCVAYVIQQE